MTKAIIFDYDGVIQDTFNFHRNKIREFTGIDIEENDFRDIHNGNFFTNKNDKLKEINWLGYRDFIYESQSRLKIENKTKDALLILSKKYDLFIISSGGAKNISDCLKNNGIDEIFKEVLGLESHKSKVDKFNTLFGKYNLTPDECIFITDTLGDILEANEVKVKTIAVDFGYHKREILEKANPSKIISELDEILTILS